MAFAYCIVNRIFSLNYKYNGAFSTIALALVCYCTLGRGQNIKLKIFMCTMYISRWKWSYIDKEKSGWVKLQKYNQQLCKLVFNVCAHTHTRIHFACSIVAHSIVSVGRSTCGVAYELAPEHKKLLNRIISIECWIVATLHWNKRAGQNRIDHFWSLICKVQAKSQVNLNGFISATNKIPTKLSFQFHFIKCQCESWNR